MAEFRGKIYDSVIDTIGATPLVRITRFAAHHEVEADLLAKLEFFNPLASVKDRIGFAMIDDAEKSGRITPGKTTLIEAICGLRIELVITAHPTEIMRRTLQHKYNRVAAALAERDRPDLTPTERQVLGLIAEYKTSREIGEALHISYRTVQAHRANICAKLELHGSHALMKFALDRKNEL